MTLSEFEAWLEFYRRWPFDDRARFHRPAALIASAASTMTEKGPAVEVMDALDWLDRKPHPTSAFSEAELATFKDAGVRPPRKE